MKKVSPLFLIVIIATFLVANTSTSQERMVKGLVTTFDSIALMKASVLVKSLKVKVFTDENGRFEVMCLPKDKLKVSAGGFVSQNVKLTPSIKLALINLKLKNTPKSAMVAVGYGHVADKDKLMAVSSMKNDGMDFSMYTNVYDLIRGRFAGVQVSGTDIIIRGQNSINLSSAALIVVDGITVGSGVLSALSPTNIKSIDILKDGSAAIYGSRGSNGVVLIETKRGDDY